MIHPVVLAAWGKLKVQPIQKGDRATKVWQHLYNRAEDWGALVEADISNLRSDSEACGCPPVPVKPRDRLPISGKDCVALLERHHEHHYGPAYLRELGSDGTRVSRQKETPEHLLCCTPRGVLVSVGLKPPVCVLTAFRPDPTHQDTARTDEAYFRRARLRWVRSVQMSEQDTWKTEVLLELETVSRTPPGSTDEAWALVWAIGHARALAPEAPDVVAPLRTAERILEQNRAQVEQQLSGKMLIAPLLSGLEAALHDGQPDETLDRLLALEDVLTVCEVLGLQPEIQHILAEVSRQVTPLRPTLAGFNGLARERRDASGTAAHALWDTLLTAASRVSSPSLPEGLARWLLRVDAARARVVHGVAGIMKSVEINAANVHPVVALGPATPAFDVSVEGQCPPEWGLRLFLVDAENPEGELLREGVDYQRQQEHWRFDGWRLQGHDDVALLVVVAGPSLPVAPSLATLLDATTSMPDIRVTEAVLSPPSVRRP
ncbi:MAG: hypothetical protein EOO71_19720 [Myxococcaceae bacterium]|nr:MAG: hypothetical protein EOO71_19720 [Myxococcaceae bacterium]